MDTALNRKRQISIVEDGRQADIDEHTFSNSGS